MRKCLYLLSVVFHMAAGCELVKKTAIEKVTGFTGESVVLPCVCTDIHHNPSSVKWEFNKKEFGKDQEIYPKLTGHHRNRVKLVSKNSPGNLSLLISDLTEEDQGIYTCFVQAEKRDLILFVEVKRGTSVPSRKTQTTPPSEQPRRKETSTATPTSSSTTQGRRETSMQSRKPDTTPPSEQPQSKSTTSLPASSSTTQGCVLSVKNHTEITQHKGGSVLLPCSCSDLLSKPQKFTWMFFRPGQWTELNNKHYRGRYQLFNYTSPANLSLLKSDLREEDQGVYRCSTEKEHRDFTLYVKGCELVKKTGVEKVTGFTGESVVLPCVCTDLQNDPMRVTWEFNKNNHSQEIYSKQTGHHSNRVKLVSKNPPGNLSLLISDLTEEDQGIYTCSAQADFRDLRLSVKVGRRETSTQWKKPDTAPPSEHPQSKTTKSQPASFLKTPEQVFGIVAVLMLVIPGVVAFICWRRKGGKCGEKVITEGCPYHKGNQKDEILSEDASFTTVTYTCYATDPH
ncbi:junctional adhesion molecule-like isoform X3 [Silurus meridionalis]|uniref:junctional adhesion molecule-like isoform X3 n=1 Tax=Silurus meridionalis TaxID=175797 RepID=UPI001EE9CB68|nr:junctional adhesion molecule-like isoform X3 [Silurus meridionalis]